MTTTTIPLHDGRETTFTVETLTVSSGTCNARAGNGECGKPGVSAVRNTIEQQRPTEGSTYRVTLCAEHQDGAPSMHSTWVASAIEMQDPVKRDAFLASAGAQP
ncbi:hypothetical protein OG692_10420 [Streptomyces cellulosae]|nr:hypothetical protein OG692_10420 [Streptomyces cellulosae]